MTGIVLMTEGIVEAHIYWLNERFGLDLEVLLAMKTRERADVAGDDTVYTETITDLFERLDAAREQSCLPEEAPNRASLNDFLVRLRLSDAGQGS